MRFWFRPRIRHPFFPGLKPISASEAKGHVESLRGGFPELEQAAGRGVSAEHAVFVLMEQDAPPLRAEQRDRLWELFQTPVYAILTGRDGRAIGFECEVQNGFHLAGRSGEGGEAACECGRAGPLLHTTAAQAVAIRS